MAAHFLPTVEQWPSAARVLWQQLADHGCVVVVREDMSVLSLRLMNPVLGCLHDLWHCFKAGIIWSLHLFQCFLLFQEVSSAFFLLFCWSWCSVTGRNTLCSVFFLKKSPPKIQYVVVSVSLLVSSTTFKGAWVLTLDFCSSLFFFFVCDAFLDSLFFFFFYMEKSSLTPWIWTYPVKWASSNSVIKHICSILWATDSQFWIKDEHSGTSDNHQ